MFLKITVFKVISTGTALPPAWTGIITVKMGLWEAFSDHSDAPEKGKVNACVCAARRQAVYPNRTYKMVLADIRYREKMASRKKSRV